tara:strand:- start:10329 stop:10580 length:252 start_codon:yes stop_codon:yes gene_type:complete
LQYEARYGDPYAVRLLWHYNQALQLYKSENEEESTKGYYNIDALLGLVGFFDCKAALEEYAMETINDNGEIVENFAPGEHLYK